MPDRNSVVLPKRLVRGARLRDESSHLDRNTALLNRDALGFNTPVDVLRSRGDTWEAIRVLSRLDGTTSTAVFNIVQIAHTKPRVAAFDSQTHQYSTPGTQLARSILASFDTLYDYTEGFSTRRSMAGTTETLLREVVMTGATGLELVLNRARLPDYLLPLNIADIEWVADGRGGRFPRQKAPDGQRIDLDIPTVWIEYSHQDPLKAYSRSMMEAALTFVFHFDEFIQDIRRVVRRSGHTRLVCVLDAEKVLAAASPEQREDPDKLRTFQEQIRLEIQDVIQKLAPEEAIVAYDFAQFEHLQSGMGRQSEYTPLLRTFSGLMATSLKSPPSVLGLRLEGSQSLSNTESLVFLKLAQAVQKPVEAVLSRAFTLACRLYGQDVYVKYEFEPISLRPEEELEAHRTMRENRIYTQLSYGFITDDEAAEALGTGPRAPSAPKLSGTMFHTGGDIMNKAKTPTPNSDPQGRALVPDTPRNAGGKDNASR